ncbi:hypothetical protein [Lysobacter gummosus]
MSGHRTAVYRTAITATSISTSRRPAIQRRDAHICPVRYPCRSR